MDQEENAQPQRIVPAVQHNPSASVFVKSLLATALLVTVLGASVYIAADNGLWGTTPSADVVSKAQAAERLKTFETLGITQLAVVPNDEVQAAVDGMELPYESRYALLASLRASTVRLARISLWDSNVEDGDAVRIDSQGFSKTIILTKKPVTLAVPVALGGAITITGTNDGEGGGITLGLASGTSRVLFPVMKAGETFSLKVAAR